MWIQLQTFVCPESVGQVFGDNNVNSATGNRRGSELGGHTSRLTCISHS